MVVYKLKKKKFKIGDVVKKEDLIKNSKRFS